MAYRKDVDGCCSAKMIVAFCGTGVASMGHRGQPSKKDLVKEVRNIVTKSKDQGNGIVVAYTNNQQRVANDVLLAEGFENTGMITKNKHPETQLIMWWKVLGPTIPVPEPKAGPKRDANGRFAKAA